MDVALVSVEVWPSETIVRLAGLPDDPHSHDRRFHESLDRWAQAGRADPQPREPAESILDVDVTLADDVGTVYMLRTSMRGGSGRLFRGDWFFATGIPADATQLVLRVDADGKELGSTAITFM
jgi:hypothetical protein